MGRQAEAALRLLVSDLNQQGGITVDGTPREVVLDCRDDASDAERCAAIYRSLCFDQRVDLLLGPYSSKLMRAAAPIVEEAGMVLVNHGGAGDDLYEKHYRMLIGVLSPASDYLTGFVRLLAGLKLWRKRLAIISARTPFALAVAHGVEHAAAERFARRGRVKVRVKYHGKFDPNVAATKLFPALVRNRVNALVSAGDYEHDVAVVRAVTSSALNIPVLACVAAGVQRFRDELGEAAEGIVGPSQWEDQFEIEPELGPAPREFASRMRAANPSVGCDYPAAQAYAAGLLAKAAVESAGSLDQQQIRAAFSDMKTTTLFGDFAIDRVTGRQIAHKVLLIQWHEARKVVIEPEPDLEAGALEFPAGFRLILSSFQLFKLSRRYEAEEVEPEAEKEDEGD